MKRTLLTVAALLTLNHAGAENKKITDEVQRDLESAQQRLTSQRQQQEEELIALSTEITELQEQLLVKRRLVDIARRSVADQEAYENKVRKKALRSSAEAQSLSSALRAYGLQLFTKQLPGSDQDSRLDGVFAKETLEETSLIERLAVIELGLEQVNNAFGGEILPTVVSKEDAAIVPGQVASFGPARWFVSDDGQHAGSYLLSKSGQVASLDSDLAEEARALVGKQTVEAKIDITGGKAKALENIKSGPLDLIKKGGAWVYPILGIALVSLICAILRAISLLGLRDKGSAWIKEVESLLSAGKTSEAVTFTKDGKHPVAEVLPAVLDALGAGFDVAEEVLFERLIPVRQQLRSLLSFISVTAAVAPLLGLLGTVSGLIKTFSVIAVEGTGEAQSISGGISEALITTLFGLIVAIPSFMIHALLIRKAKGVEQNVERIGLAVINHMRKLAK